MRRVAIVMALGCCALTAFAQSSGGAFELRRNVVAGGGGRAAGVSFALTGTIAQHEAAPPSTGSTFALSPGFWAGAPAATQPPPDALFSNGFE